ncbi:golgi apparatus membrane protein TVP18 [Gonapodya prolifera JEL478]|uniref:Golgi apparatus membrane protein TVP18 n=1 Tax=Gonapodya prolifera (strain JEL478) TaxID=1344416 RepID=A0A139AY33_GONPJ|nr:golgi apparatus membrane protein TVP18 [Gonapodya prolifera JEL478]|eukprot:KXS21483.1 golgi apparatus membrane protein TVP18 [Gonapodya prolifera JEL478]
MSFLETLIDELKSGKAGIYAQWSALLSGLFCLLFGIMSFLGMLPFAICALIFFVVILFAEIPLCLKCCPTSPTFDNFIKKFENMYFRAAAYLIMAVIIWLSLVWGASTLILPALTLSFTAIFYGIASFRHEEREASIAAGGKNAAVLAARSFV